MGPESSTPARLFFVNPETGERHELTDRIAELSITEAEGDESMSVGFRCQHCEHADPKRTKDGKIRCKRFSQWVEPNAMNCEEYSYSFPLVFDPIYQAEMMKYFERKQRG